MTTPDLDVHDMVRQLTCQHPHRESYVKDRELTDRPGTWVPDGLRGHVTWVPALILQLLDSDPSVNGTGDLAGTQPTSRPTARIDALDTVMLIDDEAGHWIDRLGGIIPADRIDMKTQRTIVGSGTVLRLRRLHGLHPSAEACGREKLIEHVGHTFDECEAPIVARHRKDDVDGWCCPQGNLEHDVRRWWYQARIVAGWDMAAWTLSKNTCPVCEVRGKLKIRLDSGLCLDCRTVWPADQLGLLAEHVRMENKDPVDVPEDAA